MKYIHTIGLFFFTDEDMINKDVVVLSEIFIYYFSLCSCLRVWLNSNRKRGRLVYVCGETSLFLSFFFAVEKCGECEKKTFLRFFSLSSLPFFSSLINGRGGMHHRNFLFFCISIQSERKKREERGREKTFFRFFSLHWFIQLKMRFNPLYRSHLLKQRHLSRSNFQ